VARRRVTSPRRHACLDRLVDIVRRETLRQPVDLASLLLSGLADLGRPVADPVLSAVAADEDADAELRRHARSLRIWLANTPISEGWSSHLDPPRERSRAMTLTARLNHHPDALPRPTIRVAGRAGPSFQILGYTGLAVAIVLTQVLAATTGRSPLVMTSVTVVCAATFLLLALGTKIVLGEEKLVYYHHEIAVLLVTAGLVTLLGQPVLPYLDLTVLGVGTFLVFGRLGCPLVGRCHGRPHRWGVRYPWVLRATRIRPSARRPSARRSPTAADPAHGVGVRPGGGPGRGDAAPAGRRRRIGAGVVSGRVRPGAIRPGVPAG